MPIKKFDPRYVMTPRIVQDLLRIQSAQEKTLALPLSIAVMSSLRKTAKLLATHYSTKIEGNKLQPNEIQLVIPRDDRPVKRVKTRDEKEALAYFQALTQVEQWASRGVDSITELMIQKLHGIVMSGGRKSSRPTAYRSMQNAVRESDGSMVYMPPQPEDVAGLMREFVAWIAEVKQTLPAPVVAAIVHYQFVTIHPYLDGNGRTARLLTTLVLHLGGYDLKGFYCLEQYYDQNIGTYYQAMTIGPSHNYYLGREQADITGWIEYFVQGMAYAFETVAVRAAESAQKNHPDHSARFKELDPKKRIILELFQEFKVVSSRQIGDLFGFKPRTRSQLCKDLVDDGFLEIVDTANKNRTYQLAKKYRVLLD